ncbi:Flp pilus assembly protein CpaB [Devosia sp.]|uniref:Flp pilus assembly protein CpaB n=1 Tax=Devosia sp. TaxID=1871048 RepID=UPI003BA90C3E
MKASRIILLLVALLAGGLAAFLATRGDAPQTVEVAGPTQIVQEAKAQILVAKTVIGVGQRLSAETVEWQDWPELAVRPEYVNKQALPDALDQMSGAVARFEFFPGEPIMEAKLVRTEQGYMSAVLAQGMRGVSVQVDPGAAAGGYIMPNDRVDIVLSHASSNNSTQSETILTNIKVLAIDKRLGETGTTGQPKDPADPTADVFQQTAIATLELTPAQGELVINATKVGTLSLALRSIADYTVAAGQDPVRQTNKAIRLIRAGKDSNVTTASGSEQTAEVNTDGMRPPAVEVTQGQVN